MMINMKKLYIVGFVAFILLACNEKLDEIKPIGEQTEYDQFTTAQGAELALLGCYNVQGLYELNIFLVDFYGDLGMGSSTATPSVHSAQRGEIPPNSKYDETWLMHYVQINRVNLFIKNIDLLNPRFSPERRKYEALGEARALRALAYFMLVQSYGPVPLRLETNLDDFYPPRSSVEDVYAKIIEDLDFAIEHLRVDYPVGIISRNSDQVEWGRVTKYAAVALKAKVLLTAPEPLGDIVKAEQYLGQVINSQRFSLLPDWTNIFHPDFRRNNPETVWPYMFTNAFQGGGSKLAHMSRPQSTWFRPKDWMYEFYEEQDVRRDATILKGWRENFLVKYNQGSHGDERDNHPMYFIRYPDVLLMRAEALAKINFNQNREVCVDLLNQVRQRANATIYDVSDFPDQDAFFDKLMDEYHREFFFEFHTWFTFKRFGIERTFERQKIELNESTRYKLYMPIPSIELIRNPNLYQNEGYAG